MPLRTYLRFALKQLTYFLFASQHLALIIAQAILILFAFFTVGCWFVGLLDLIWKTHPIEFENGVNRLVVWAMGSRSFAHFSGSYHANTEQTLAFLSKVYFITTIPIFLYDLLRKTPLSSKDRFKRRVKWAGIIAGGIALSCLVFRYLWPENTWTVFALLALGNWIAIFILAGYVFFLERIREGVLTLFDEPTNSLPPTKDPQSLDR